MSIPAARNPFDLIAGPEPDSSPESPAKKHDTVIKKLFGILLGLIVALVMIGFLLPTTIQVERRLDTAHSPELVNPVLADLRHFSQWAPWLLRRPETAWHIEGREPGVGQALVWQETEHSAESRLRIVAVRPGRVDLVMERGAVEFESWWEVEAIPGGSQLRWGMQARLGALDLVGRYLGLVLPRLAGREYREGLERLDAYLERSQGRLPSLPEAEWQ